MAFVAYDESTDSENGSTNGGEIGSGNDTGGDEGSETDDSSGTGNSRWTPQVSNLGYGS